ncbi:MAG: hypothetical protein LKI39_02215 [Bacteroides sp.]|jgi:NADPH-dependent glutamate synthase beta subunit-like oxidoreductase|nr:hypothetical protein [Bacteroides sp.]
MNAITLENSEKGTRICGCCHKELSIDSFYVNKHTNLPDNYCKECRRSFSNLRYRYRQVTKKKPQYPVITEISDKDLRIKFLLNALDVVHRSIERKKKRLREEEYRNESPDEDF